MHPEALFEFELFGKEFGLYPYGLCIAIGLLACVFVLFFYTKKFNFDPDVMDFTFFVAIFAIAGGFLSASLFQSLYEYIATGVWSFPSGLTVMGGIVGGVVMFLLIYFGVGHFVFKSRNNIHVAQFNEILRIAPCCITVAHAFGRIGCLFAGCCHGEYLGKEYVFGGILMDVYGGPTGYYVPIQLYEALFLFALFAVLSVLYFKRFNVTASVYLVVYGIWRIVIEEFRTDVGRPRLWIFTPSQWQSSIFILLGIAIFLFFYFKKYPIFLKKSNEGATKQSKVE